MANLSASDQAVILQASPQRIVTALQRHNIRQSAEWLPTAHPCRDGVPPATMPTRPNDYQKVIDLIAVSAPNHAVDGWGFLARGIQSLAAGDPHSARHFAYYAELRAALSLLACCGIGIFKNWNCVTRSSGDLVGFGRPSTHSMVWSSLEAWATSKDSGKIIGEALSINSTTFSSALDSMWPGQNNRLFAKTLALKWGFDLSQMTSDRDARNTSSYDPQCFVKLNCDADDTIEFITGLWGVFEPRDAVQLGEIDRHLFRMMVHEHCKSIHGQTCNVKKQIELRYRNLPAQMQSSVSLSFLADPSIHTPRLINDASRRTPVAQPVEIISRAALLLRTATAVTVKLLRDAGYDKAVGLKFWSNEYGRVRGFWTTGSGAPSPMTDLWGDVQTALDNVKLLRAALSKPLEQADWASTPNNGLPRLHEVERIALWALCE